MTRPKRLILTSAVLILMFAIFSNIVGAAAATKVPIDVNSSNSAKAGLTEAEAYKMLYEAQVDANEKILNTVYWSLGLAITLITFLLGANLFNNIRAKKNETELLSSQFTNQLEEIKLTFLSDIKDASMKNIETAVSQKFAIVDTKLSVISSGLISTKEAGESLESDIKNNYFVLSGRINQLEGLHWKSKGVMNNVVTCYVDGVEEILKGGGHAKPLLSELITIMNENQIGFYLSIQSAILRIIKMLSAKEEYSVQLEQLKEILQKYK
ncbi:hypothetical protein I8J29_24580 [Paenibacillus sp. MWE-103]|uniref:Uncharacterized protein n=1 Tax=Paenibacillus artemisiicola TaxID=1172618 RepID=A0ABS3WGA6_9BACL|nr:hypothetical protein [Paenibacillus artemisiicola]MBO7747366.1 hypothetical protein [Paenibacillus artemisiicola]